MVSPCMEEVENINFSLLISEEKPGISSRPAIDFFVIDVKNCVLILA